MKKIQDFDSIDMDNENRINKLRQGWNSDEEIDKKCTDIYHSLESDNGLTIKEITDRVSWSKSTVDRVLNQLELSGKVRWERLSSIGTPKKWYIKNEDREKAPIQHDKLLSIIYKILPQCVDTSFSELLRLILDGYSKT